jgi:hypothetical protein
MRSLPAMARLVDEFEQVMAEGTSPQRKHLLQRVVKKSGISVN